MNSTLTELMKVNPALMHTVFASLPEPTFLISKTGVYVEAWGGRDTTRHHDPRIIIGLDQYQVLPADKAVWFSQVVVDVIESQTPAELEYSLDPKSLSCFNEVEGPKDRQFFNALVIPLPDTEFVLWTVRNITEHQNALERLAKQQLELEKITHLDHLTKVYNRYALDVMVPDVLELAYLNQTGCALLMIDLDCFKQYNDRYGHLKGDDVLESLGATLMNWCSAHDLCFRYGGDEFLVVCPNIRESECLERAEQLRDQVNALAIEHLSSTVSNCVSITIGIHYCPHIPHPMSTERLVAVADKALFFAKKQRRGTIHQINQW